LKKSFDPHPGLSLRSNPGLKLANAFGVSVSFLEIRGFSEFLILWGALPNGTGRKKKTSFDHSHAAV
jgi:hypothetical protein